MNKIFSVAPMLDWTDRHCRYFHGLLSPSITLYSEMVTANALIHGDAHRHLHHTKTTNPVVLQLGGSNPADLATAVKIAAPFHYDEYNLNCGCPSDRVQNGAFGACLMNTPDIVRDCISAMMDATDKPVTIKCRIGIDDADEEKMLRDFIETVAQSGCNTFIIHARKAWLKGLSPKENRDIPPLNYDLAATIKKEYPHLNIQLNGGLTTLDQIHERHDEFDGFMIGRQVYHSPRFLQDIEATYGDKTYNITDADIIEKMIGYANTQSKDHGTPIKSITRHMINLYQGVKGARQWRRHLSENAHLVTCAEDILRPAYQHILDNQNK